MLLKDSLSDFVEKAKINFANDGYLAPIFAATIDDSFDLMLIPASSTQEKHLFSLFIQDLIAKNRLTEYIMIMEAWSASVEDDLDEIKRWLQTEGTLSTWPNRKEIVSILYCSAQEEIHYTADIIRGRMSPVLENWNTSKHKVKFAIQEYSSRFSGLFLKGKAGAN